MAQIGNYRVLRPLATGGMAEISVARQTGIEGFERLVVLKRIHDHRARNPEFVTMFLDEARIAARLAHPNVAQVYDLGRAGSSYFIAMEYVRGADLRRLLDEQAARHRGGLPIEIAVPIAIALSEALQYLHDAADENGHPLGIVHRDVNPRNVVISYEGAVKLIDFGIAKAAIKVYETTSGVIKGTCGYMAPEQIRGKKSVDRRTDLFGLGVILYEATVGLHPFAAPDEVGVADKILRCDFVRPREILPSYPEDLERIVRHCLAPTPDERFASARELQDQLEGVLSATGTIPSMARLGRFVRDRCPDGLSGRDLFDEAATAQSPTPASSADSDTLRDSPLSGPTRRTRRTDPT